MDVNTVLKQIKNRDYKPVYLLHGDESYFIDLVSDLIEQSVLTDAQKGFDQTVLYGKETDFSTIVNTCKRYPMMSDYQVVIVKEAHAMKWGDDELLQKYLEHPTPTTLLVFAYKHASFDKRKKTYKLLDKAGVIVESKKIYDDKVAPWITQQFDATKRKIHPQAAAMMAEYLGSDLSKVANEIEKLLLNVDPQAEVSVADIERNIGISKDFNVFELNSALAKRHSLKAYQIVDYFAANPKSNPIQVIIGALGGYFTKVLKYHYLPDKTGQTAAKELGVHPFFLKEYEIAARSYHRRKVFDVIHVISEYDLKSKGLGVGAHTSSGELLKELIYKILS